jgi:hypothetical protein
VKLSACALLVALVSCSTSNDGWIGYTGTPRVEGKHPSIRMVEEVIHLRIGKGRMTANCLFTFKNEGNACTARIGFPDHDSDPYLDPKTGIRSIYTYFRSYVDGKRVQTKLVDAGKDYGWQVKHVPFGKGQVRKVRNVYEVGLGQLSLEGVAPRPPMTWQAEYVVTTGRSWKGTIGSTKVIVDLERSAPVKSPIKLVSWPNNNDPDKMTFWSKNRNAVMWSGFAPPKASRRRLVFERKNWEPSKDDDVTLRFGLWFRPND